MNDPGTKRKQMWLVNKLCFWCGKETIWHEQSGFSPEDGCTLDHLYRIKDARRSLCPTAFVLACYKCNRERAFEQEGTKAISGLFPKNTELSFIEVIEGYEKAKDTTAPALVVPEKPVIKPKRRTNVSLLWGAITVQIK